MPRKRKDIAGFRYGKLIAIKYVGDFKWLCRCDCGKFCVVSTGNLTNEHTKSCGCEMHTHNNLRHGMADTRLYNTWSHMKSRCINPNDNAFRHYGGRGIKVCDEWTCKDGFTNFVEWALKNGYKDTLTIDRIDVNGNYEPNNCRWVDCKIQQNNRRNNHTLTYNGVTKTISQWATQYGSNPDRIYARLKLGWSIERALTTPKMINKFKFAKE